MTRLLILVILALLTVGCGASSTAPSAVPSVHVPANLPIVVSGQSNAVNLFFADAFPAQYPNAECAGCLANMPISAWAPGSDLWAALDASLHRPLTAVVWWQGERDYNLNNRAYAADLRALLARVRAANSPHLLVALVEIIPYAGNAFIRQAQEEVAGGDPDVVLVKMDGIPTDGENHLVWLPGLANGYVPATQRILTAIATRY